MVEIPSGPGYLRLAEQLRQHIRDEGLQIGDVLPTALELGQRFEETRGVVRKALEHLKYEGTLVGHQGRPGYTIARLPGEVEPETTDSTRLRQLVRSLRDEVRRLAEDVAELRREVRGSGT